MINTSEITAAVLAGGAGTRLGGVDKGWIRVGGEALVEGLLRVLEGQVGHVIINCNANMERYAAVGCPVIADPAEASGGPVAGVFAVWPHVRTRYLLLLPVDAVQLPIDVIAALKDALDSYPVAISRARQGADRHPTCVLLDRQIVQRPSHPGGSLMAWQSQYAVHEVAVDSGIQLSVNTPEELRIADGVIDQAARLSSNSAS